MKLLESFIKNVIVEDLDSFLRDTKGIYYSELTDDEAVKSGGKDIKRIWAQNVDRNFIQSLTKIHWIRTPNVARLQNILQKDGKDEISAMAYLPGAKIRTTWSNVGVVLDGYVTLAANNMDYIYSGFSHGKSRDQRQAGSGIAKRPGMFEPRLAKGYILDMSSFNPATQGHNEILLDNWKVKGLILPVYGSTMKSSKVDKALFAELAQLVSNSGLKLYDISLNELSLEDVVNMANF